MGPNFSYNQLQHYPHQAQAMQMSQTPMMPQSPMMAQTPMQGPMQGPMYPMRMMSGPGAAMSPHMGPEGMMMHQQVSTKNIQL